VFYFLLRNTSTTPQGIERKVEVIIIDIFSLGSTFWPTNRPELITTILDSLLSVSPPFPFIFATASPKASLSAELREKVKTSGRGLILDWVDQVKVLKHPAIGVFLVCLPLLLEAHLTRVRRIAVSGV
jgi:hypothetical protein